MKSSDPLAFAVVGCCVVVAAVAAEETAKPPSQATSVGAATVVELQPGQWEITTRRERDGARTMLPTKTSCLTPAMAARHTPGRNPESRLAALSKTYPAISCKLVEWKKVGVAGVWRIECQGGVNAEQTGSFTPESSQRFVEETRTTVRIAQTTIVSAVTIEGRRTGECMK